MSDISKFLESLSKEKREFLKENCGPAKGYLDEGLSEKDFIKGLGVFLRDPEFEKILRKKGKFTDDEINKLSDISSEGTTTPQKYISEGMQILREYDFPIDKYPDTANFLAKYPADLRRIVEATGKKARVFFQIALPANAAPDLTITWKGKELPFINEHIWPGLVTLVELAKGEAVQLFNLSLPPIVGVLTFWGRKEISFINEHTWPDIIKVAKVFDFEVNLFFSSTLPALFTKYKMIQEGRKVPLVNGKTWPMFAKGLLAIAKARSFDLRRYSANPPQCYLYCVGWTKISWGGQEFPFINEHTWPGLVRMVEALGGDTWRFFDVRLGSGKRPLLPFLAGLRISWEGNEISFINEHTWPVLVKIIETAKFNSINLFKSSLPVVNDLIDENNWDDFAQFFIYIGKSLHRIRRMRRIFKKIDPKAKPFLLYLILTKPKATLGILGKSYLLEFLGINFRQELDLFLKIGSPITLQEKDFRALNSIVSPLNDLNPRIRKKFLKSLDLSISTFQGVSLSFLKSLQATEGFENIDDYSFVDLVYIYLRYAQDPEIKVKKLKKALGKLHNNEKKCLNLIEGRENIGKLNEMHRKMLKETLKKMADVFFEPLNALYREVFKDRLKENMKRIFKVEVNDKDILNKAENESFHNAVEILKQLESKKRPAYQLCFNLIQNYLVGKTYPLTKNIWDCHPWNLPPNKDWCRKHLKNDWWVKDFRKKYKITSEEVKKTNVKDRIKHHLKDSQRIITELGFQIKDVSVKNIEAIYKKVASEITKYDETLVSDLKTQVNSLTSLMGEHLSEGRAGQKIVIQPEFDPLEVLQMGNYVSGSCLNTNGANYWSTVVNAVEVNKRVLWAKDKSGNILARRLIAVDDDDSIVVFPVYYETNIKLEDYFNDYIKDLAKKCGFKIGGKTKRVALLFDTPWYTDREDIV